jgi:hypothetical protein
VLLLLLPLQIAALCTAAKWRSVMAWDPGLVAARLSRAALSSWAASAAAPLLSPSSALSSCRGDLGLVQLSSSA